MNTTHDEAFGEQQDFFRRQPGGTAPGVLELPAAGARAGDARYSSVPFLLPHELSADIRSGAHAAGLSPHDSLLAGLKALIFRHGIPAPIVCVAADGGRAGQGRLGDSPTNWA